MRVQNLAHKLYVRTNEKPALRIVAIGASDHTRQQAELAAQHRMDGVHLADVSHRRLGFHRHRMYFRSSMSCRGIGAVQLDFASAMRSAALAPITMLGAWVCPRMMVGITDASATRSPCTPRTSSRDVTTLAGSVPIRQVPTG